MAKICLNLYSKPKTSNKVKYVESIGWLNINIFDFQNYLISSTFDPISNTFTNSNKNTTTFNFWMYNEPIIGSGINPLGTVVLDKSNKYCPFVKISFNEYPKPIKGPTKEDVNCLNYIKYISICHILIFFVKQMIKIYKFFFVIFKYISYQLEKSYQNIFKIKM